MHSCVHTQEKGGILRRIFAFAVKSPGNLTVRLYPQLRRMHNLIHGLSFRHHSALLAFFKALVRELSRGQAWRRVPVGLWLLVLGSAQHSGHVLIVRMLYPAQHSPPSEMFLSRQPVHSFSLCQTASSASVLFSVVTSALGAVPGI